MRAHIILSDNVVKKVDNLVGKRKRSRFVEEAVREKLKRETLMKALEETGGALSAEDHSEWGTAEETALWVRETRKNDDERLKKFRNG